MISATLRRGPALERRAWAFAAAFTAFVPRRVPKRPPSFAGGKKDRAGRPSRGFEAQGPGIPGASKTSRLLRADLLRLHFFLGLRETPCRFPMLTVPTMAKLTRRRGVGRAPRLARADEALPRRATSSPLAGARRRSDGERWELPLRLGIPVDGLQHISFKCQRSLLVFLAYRRRLPPCELARRSLAGSSSVYRLPVERLGQRRMGILPSRSGAAAWIHVHGYEARRTFPARRPAAGVARKALAGRHFARTTRLRGRFFPTFLRNPRIRRAPACHGRRSGGFFHACH